MNTLHTSKVALSLRSAFRLLPILIFLVGLSSCGPLASADSAKSTRKTKSHARTERIVDRTPKRKKVLLKRRTPTSKKTARRSPNASAKTRRATVATPAPRRVAKPRATAKPKREDVSGAEALFRSRVAAVASQQLGKRYVYGSKGPNTFDCSGLTSHVLRELGRDIYGNSMSQAKRGRAVRLEDAKPGDLVYFKNPRGQVNHIALVVGNDRRGVEVIHATTSRGVIREYIEESSYWKPRIAGARDVNAVRNAVASSR